LIESVLGAVYYLIFIDSLEYCVKECEEISDMQTNLRNSTVPQAVIANCKFVIGVTQFS